MRLEREGEVYDTENSILMAEDMEDEHPCMMLYKTEEGRYFKTESTYNMSIAWRYHNQITILTAKEALEILDDYDPEFERHPEEEHEREELIKQWERL